MNIGTAIKQIRNKKRIRQIDLARETGITQTYLSLIENNTKVPNLSTIKTIAQVLDTPLQILLYLSIERNDIRYGKSKVHKKLDPLIRKVIDDYFLKSDSDDGKN